ncbi:MAG: preprotein translocase subunit SecG [Spirochaetaceae bacterium 4572_7]|nr:MAG: preprotein translocase subunit SecG [Spirochaetaceae bacterium 4572_7]
MGFVSTLLLVLAIIVAVLLVAIVLIQDDQGEGLGSMFGGSSSSPFGAKSGSVLVKATTVLGVLFFVSSIGLAWVSKTSSDDDILKAAIKADIESADGSNWWDESSAKDGETEPVSDSE